MLDSLRTASRSWVSKLLLLLLVASFAIWGVSASIMSPNSTSVMTVGDQRISPEEFRLAYQRQLATLSRQFGTQLTTEQARAFGIDQQAFSQLAAGASLDQLSQDMRLGLSQDRLAGLIAQDPAFLGNDGRFDRQLFSTRLRNAGLREEDYIKERSKVAVRSQIVDAVSDGFQPPKVLTDVLKQYRDQSRDVSYLLLSYANIDPVKAPSDVVLGAWYEGVKARYRAPEQRRFSYLTLQPSDVADPTSVTDEQVRAEYERRKDSYKTPETRTVEQLAFPSKEMAQAALQQMKERQLTFDALVSDQGKSAADVMLGDFTRDQLPDAAIATAVFALGPQGGVTPVVEGAFGPVVLRVTNVRPEVTRSFDAVKDDIRRQLSLSAAAQDVQSVHDRVEDMRGSGSSLEEAAAQLKLKTGTITSDRSGQDDAGKPVAGLPASESLLTEVFRTDVGAESLPANLGNDGYVWFDVREVIPERDRTLSEVRDRALADWTNEQQRSALSAKAEELKLRLENGATLAAIGEDLGLAVETKTSLRRQAGDDAIFGAEAIKAAFAGPAGINTTASGADGDSRLLMHVDAVNDQPAAETAAGSDQQVQQIARAAGDDMLDQMVNQLQTAYGVSINHALADQAMVR
ncbi:peptidylprolyl isomerase [Rhizobium sp. FY34]|uniref:peptidylprolyl isomerase n=1 Tax=Rhizobium sp. FY34 TaxID=2562309 RepID=UPI0010C0E9E1|nr:peptidylprolyl isomerase [Rhizobium sp. FY34]